MPNVSTAYAGRGGVGAAATLARESLPTFLPTALEPYATLRFLAKGRGAEPGKFYITCPGCLMVKALY